MKKLDVKKLAGQVDNKFVSIFMTTHRNGPESNQDSTQFKNLIKEAENKLEQLGENPSDYLEKAYDMVSDKKFWQQSTEGLAYIATSEDVYIRRLYGVTKDIVTISDKPHLLPFYNFYELPNDYYLIDIARDRFEIYETSIDKVEMIELPDIKKYFVDLYEDKDDDDSRLSPTRGSSSGVHAHMTKSQNDELETEKYFRYLSNQLKKFVSQNDLPLILFGTTENVHKFKEYAQDLNIKATVEKPLHSLEDSKEIVATMKKVLLPAYVEKVDSEIENLNSNIANDKGSSDSGEIKRQAEIGRVEKLFVNKEYSLDTKEVDDIVAKVLVADGQILLIDTEQNDFDNVIKAQYRY